MEFAEFIASHGYGLFFTATIGPALVAVWLWVITELSDDS